MKHKYILVKIEGWEQHFPFIFPEQVIHKDMMAAATRFLCRSLDVDPDEITAVSAGCCEISDMYCFGDSETLGLTSRHQDADLMSKQ